MLSLPIFLIGLAQVARPWMNTNDPPLERVRNSPPPSAAQPVPCKAPTARQPHRHRPTAHTIETCFCLCPVWVGAIAVTLVGLQAKKLVAEMNVSEKLDLFHGSCGGEALRVAASIISFESCFGVFFTLLWWKVGGLIYFQW